MANKSDALSQLREFREAMDSSSECRSCPVLVEWKALAPGALSAPSFCNER